MSSLYTREALHLRIAQDLRDNFLTFGARGRVRASSFVSIEPVGGFLVAIREHWSQQEGGYPRLKDSTRAFGFSLGLEGRIGSPRVGIVPGFRFFWITKDASTNYPGGSSQLTIAPSGSVQVNF